MLEVCDTVHVLNLERIERQTLADRQVVMAAIAAGAKDMTLPSVQEAWDCYEEALVSMPAAVDQERLILLQSLGLA